MFEPLWKTFITSAILQPEDLTPTLFAEDLSGNAFQYSGTLHNLYFSYFLNCNSILVFKIFFFSGTIRRVLTVLKLHGYQAALLSGFLSSLVFTFILYPSIVVETNTKFSRLNRITVMKTIYNKQGLLGFYVGYGNFVVRYFYNLVFLLIM